MKRVICADLWGTDATDPAESESSVAEQTVTAGLQTTFDLLGRTKNEAAVNVLLPGLDAADPAIQEGALRALLDRRSVVGGRDIVRRLHQIPERWRDIISTRSGRMSQALREGLLSPDPQICTNACQAIEWFAEYDLIVPLVNAAEDPANPNSELACRTLVSLVNLLYGELSGPRNYKRRDPQLVRRNMVTALEGAVSRYTRHGRIQIMECYLMLVGRDDVALRQILSDPKHPNYQNVIDVVLRSTHPGVLRLLLSFLDDSRPPMSMLHLVGRRCDMEFLRALLRKVGHEPSARARAGLRRVEIISWADPASGVIENLDESLQASAMQLLLASGIRRQAVFEMVEHLLTVGQPAARRVAAQMLNHFSGAEANRVAALAMEDEDDEVRAEILRQIRPRAMPGALATLVSLVDSPSVVMRDAAREALSEFSFKRYLATFETLEEDVQRTTGMLVKKIDPGTLPQLRAELESPSRLRRLRGLAIVAAVDEVRGLLDVLLPLLEDEDHMVRLAVIRAMEHAHSPEIEQALHRALGDSSTLVVEAAQRVLSAHAPAAVSSSGGET